MTGLIRFGVSVFMGALLAIVLAACGGGGGDNGTGGGALFVDLVYSDSINLFENKTVKPTLIGFYGRAQNCVFDHGVLPAGMTFNSDCSISGRATQSGVFSFTNRVTASNTSGSVLIGGSLVVVTPYVTYPLHGGFNPPFKQGDDVNDLPSFPSWVSQGTWSYSIRSGSLPTGLTLNPVTGAISGSTTTAGSYRATIGAVWTTAYGSYSTSVDYNNEVSLVKLAFTNTGGTGSFSGIHTIYVSQPFSASPIAYKAGALSNFGVVRGRLPNDMNLINLDLNTGVISGTKQVSGHFPDGAPAESANISASLTDNGVVENISGDYSYQLRSPVQITYPSNIQVNVGTPVSISPTVTQVSPLPLVSYSHAYQRRTTSGQNGCDLAPGTTYDQASGMLTGIPTVAGLYGCIIDIAFANNGYNWTQGVYLLLMVR